MDEAAVRRLLDEVRTGTTSPDDAVRALRDLPYADLGFARVDHHRALRLGMPEVVLGQSKTAEQIAGIAKSLIASGQNVLVTRLDAEKARAQAHLGRINRPDAL